MNPQSLFLSILPCVALLTTVCLRDLSKGLIVLSFPFTPLAGREVFHQNFLAEAVFVSSSSAEASASPPDVSCKLEKMFEGLEAREHLLWL